MRKVIASEFVSLDEYSDQMTVNQGARGTS
jgi:hypothetical protein